MPIQSTLTTGEVYQEVISITINPTAIPAFSTLVETFSVTGLNVTHMVVADMPSLEAGVVLKGARAQAGAVELTLENFTGAEINPASQTLKLVVL